MPVQLVTAEACGALVRGPRWRGSVCSVFPAALNIVRDDGLVVSIVGDHDAMTAMSILVPAAFPPAGIRGAEAEALNGGGARFDGERLHLPPVTVVELAGAPLWEGTVPTMPRDAITPEVLRTAEAALLRHGRRGGLIGLAAGTAGSGPFADSARAALRDGRPEALVGLGPGLTPAGDDFLTGVLLAESSGDLPSPLVSRASRAKIEAVASGTTPGGRTLLWQALQGRFPAYLLRFLQALAGPTTAVEPAVRSACAHGETSGTDALSGFLWALRISASPGRPPWQFPREPRTR